MEKIDIAELLKDCPKGMELNCTMYDNCTFDGIDDVGYTEILVKTPSGRIRLTKEGCFVHQDKYAKCVIFPKGKTTWEGFVPPCKFKDGDVISDSLGTCIFKGEGRIKGTVDYYCGVHSDYFIVKDNKSNPDGHYGHIVDYRFATEGEKERLFKAIKDNGHKWNAETKTLEELDDLKFKIGDRITNGIVTGKIRSRDVDSYQLDNDVFVFFSALEEWKLVPNKFDITTLKPFDKVLVRDHDKGRWDITFYELYDNTNKSYPYYALGGTVYKQCIPYEGNEHLVGLVRECDEYYKTWTNEED